VNHKVTDGLQHPTRLHRVQCHDQHARLPLGDELLRSQMTQVAIVISAWCMVIISLLMFVGKRPRLLGSYREIQSDDKIQQD
jgi:hypothetical protein